MNHKEWKNKAIFGRLMESFGYKALNEGEMVDEVVEKEEELDEAHCGRREDDEEELEEGAKPDFLDLDKDGDKEEPMKKAAEDAKEDKVDEETIREAVRKAIKKAIL